MTSENKPTAGTSSSENARTIRMIGDYDLIAKLGQGGMGSVFKARQRSLDRLVALKVLTPNVAKNAKFIERFQREARASAKLNHPNIVQGIDVGHDAATGFWYFAMELVEGPTLKQVLAEQRVIPEKRALKIAREIASALECAEQNGIVHRDIKPDNILLTKRGEAKLADLGLAREINNEDATVTQTGQAIGTPHYMAPEQVRGKSDEFDIRTDIYALGGTLFHLVTGQPPFSGETAPAIMSKHLSEPPPKASKVSPAVSDACSKLIHKMMQKKREQRVQTPRELIAEIDAILAGDPSQSGRKVARATGARTPVRGRTEAARGTRGGIIAVGICVVLLGIAVVFGLLKGRAPQQPVVALNPDSDQKTNETLKTQRPPPAVPPALVEKTRPPATVQAPEERQKSKDVAIEPEKVEKVAAIPPPKTDPKTVEKALPAEEKKTPEPETADEKPDTIIAGKKTPPKPDDIDTAKIAPARVAAEGGGFKLEYFEGLDFGTASTTLKNQTADFKWVKGAPADFDPALGVSARWTGWAEPPESGEYSFQIGGHAASRLFVDDSLIYDAWFGKKKEVSTSAPVLLEKGKRYALRFEAHNRGAEPVSATLKWASADGEMAPVLVNPTESALPVGHLQGWTAEYGALGTVTPLLTRKETAICWDWGAGSPAAEIPVDKFWSHWSGLVSPPETDEYTFHVDADDGARLFINGMLMVDFYFLPSAKYDSPPIRLEKGRKYLLRLEHIERADNSRCVLKWSSKTLQEALVPSIGDGKPDDALPPDGFAVEYGHLGVAKPILARREIQAGWNWKSGSPAPEISHEKFWAHYRGWIMPPKDGEYTFSIDHDTGVHAYLDDIMIYDSGYRGAAATADVGPFALKGGKHYSIRLDYWQVSDYAHLIVQWQSPEMTKRLLTGMIPSAIHAESRDVGHLDCAVLAEYGSYTAKSGLKRLENRLIHDFHSATPAPDIGGAFWGKWTGGLRVPATGNYSFRVEAEWTGEMHLNGVSVIKVPATTRKVAKGAGARATSGDTEPLGLNKGVIYLLELAHTSRKSEYNYFKLTWKPPGKDDFEDIPPETFVIPPGARESVRRQ